MNWIADLSVLLMIASAALIGRKNGFIKTFFSFFGSLISFVVASVLARPTGVFIGERFFAPVLKNKVIAAFLEGAQDRLEQIDFSSLPDSYQSLLARFGVDFDEVHSFVSGLASSSGEETAEKVAVWIVDPIAEMAGIALMFVLLFIGTSLAVRLAVKALDLIARLPILNFSNHLLGLALGAAWGILLAFVFSGVLNLLEPTLQGSESLFLSAFDVEKTILVRFFTQFDLFGIFTAVRG